MVIFNSYGKIPEGSWGSFNCHLGMLAHHWVSLLGGLCDPGPKPWKHLETPSLASIPSPLAMFDDTKVGGMDLIDHTKATIHLFVWILDDNLSFTQLFLSRECQSLVAEDVHCFRWSFSSRKITQNGPNAAKGKRNGCF